MTLRLQLAAVVLLCVGLTPVGQAAAQSRFNAAVEAWLEGDDESSLPVFADFARGGHAEARLLLGRLETEDMGITPYRHALIPAEARALFRDEAGSRFGRSWLATEAEEGNELAALLLASKEPIADLAVIKRLASLGELQATDHPTRILALYGTIEQQEALSGSEAMLPELAPYLAYLSAEPEPSGDGMAVLRHIVRPKTELRPDDDGALGMAGLLALGLGFGDHSADNPWRGEVEAWVLSSTATRPIALLCQSACPDEEAACGMAFLAVSGGYFEAIRFDSPLERVIAQARFLESPRAKQMVLNKAAMARTETNLRWLADLPELDEISICAAQTIRDARTGYLE